MHLEGAEPLAPDLSDLERLVRARPALGRDRLVAAERVRRGRARSGSRASPDTGPGLTDAGRDLVARLQPARDPGRRLAPERGGLLGRRARYSHAPLVATHSNAHALCASSRNLTDAQLDAIGESGGVVGVNFAVAFLREDGATDRTTPLDEIVRHVDYIADADRRRPRRVRLRLRGRDRAGRARRRRRAAAARRGAAAARATTTRRSRKITHGNWLRVLDETWRPWGRYFDSPGDDPRPTLLDAVGALRRAGARRRPRRGHRPRHGRAAAARLARGRDRRRAGGDRPAASARRRRESARLETRVAAVRGRDVAGVRPRQRELRAAVLPARTVRRAVGPDRRLAPPGRPVLRPALRRARRVGADGDRRPHAGRGRASCWRRSRSSGSRRSRTRGRPWSGRRKHWHLFHVVARKR